MKLLLTSTGITNKSIEDELVRLVGKALTEVVVAYIPTAINVARPTDKRWMIENLERLDQMKVGAIDVLDFSAVPKDIWLPRLQKADVIMVEGGNPYHLMYSMKQAGIIEILKDLLNEKIYVGCSAGSVILGEKVVTTAPRKYSEEISEYKGDNGLGFVDFSIRPHFYRKDRPDFTDDKMQELADKFRSVFYAIDDDTTVVVEGKNIEVISEGKWGRFENK
jgi:dipeptidase E